MSYFKSLVKTYRNTLEINDAVYTNLTIETDSITYLKEHRDFIEKNMLGFGERAFHAMWLMILEYLTENFKEPNLLEIGVYKGQVISLWALIAKKLNYKLTITGISPFAGNPIPKNKLLVKFLNKISNRFKMNLVSGNFYEDEDYLKIIQSLFSNFNIDLNKIKLVKGYSSDKEVLDQIVGTTYQAIYIDGDHSFEGVTNDIKNYSNLISKDGLLIMDDAACNIPSSKFWKGHQSVSDACFLIEKLGLENILNVGHNRIYRKL